MTDPLKQMDAEERKAHWDQQKLLWEVPMEEWPSDFIIKSLVESYAPTEVPPCPICGSELTLQGIGGGRPTSWACTQRRPEDEDFYGPEGHYTRSRWEDRRQGGDDRVMELIRRFLEKAST